MFKILSVVPIVFLVACSSAQTRQDMLDYDKTRLDVYRLNQLEQNAIRAKADVAAAEVCKTDANPGLCIVASRLVTADIGKQVEQMPQRTPVPENKFWAYAMNLTGKVLDVGLSAYGIRQSNDTARYGIGANKDLILGLTDNIGRNAGTHLGDGSNYYAGNYTQDNSDHSDHSIDRSVSVGGDQNIAGRDVINGHVGDTVGRDQILVGGDQNIAGEDLAIGDANFNNGRIGSDGPFIDCASGNTGNSTGGNGGTGSTTPGGAGGAPGTGVVQCAPGK